MLGGYLWLIFKASYVSSCSHLVLHRTEKDKAPPSPYLTINNNGDVEVQNDQVLVSTCRMHIYKFPFDVQSCNLSFKSAIHSGESVFKTVYCHMTVINKSPEDLRMVLLHSIHASHLTLSHLKKILNNQLFTSFLSQRHSAPGKRQLL